MNGVGYGQSDAQWAIRTAPRVKRAFAAIWDTDDLIVSFDGGNAFRPHDYNPSWFATYATFFLYMLQENEGWVVAC